MPCLSPKGCGQDHTHKTSENTLKTVKVYIIVVSILRTHHVKSSDKKHVGRKEEGRRRETLQMPEAEWELPPA